MYIIDIIHIFRGMGANTVHIWRHVKKKKKSNHYKCLILPWTMKKCVWVKKTHSFSLPPFSLPPIPSYLRSHPPSTVPQSRTFIPNFPHRWFPPPNIYPGLCVVVTIYTSPVYTGPASPRYLEHLLVNSIIIPCRNELCRSLGLPWMIELSSLYKHKRVVAGSW